MNGWLHIRSAHYSHLTKVGMCGIDFLLRFGFLEKIRTRFRMSWVQFTSKTAVQFGYYSYLLLL